MNHGLLQDLAIVMVVAGAVVLLFQKLKLPAVLGYIIAGVLIGPQTPPFTLIRSEESIHTLSELGVVFLMFSLGLEFSLRKLRAVGFLAGLAGVLEISGMMVLGNLLGRAMGYNAMDSLFLGAIMAISSTTIIVKVLSELGLKRKEFAEMVFGMLVIEDLAAIVMLAVFTGLSAGKSVVGGEALFTLGKLGVFLIVALVLGLLAIPRFITRVSGLKNDEVLLVTVLGFCLGFAALVQIMGYSVALGAFLMGAMLAESRAIGRIEALMLPLRDLFCAVFFVSVGLLIDPGVLRADGVQIILISLTLILGKTLLCALGAFITGRNLVASLRVGMSMAQIGEFSFVIAALGRQQGLTGDHLYPIAVSVSALTTFTTPWLIRSSAGVANRFVKYAPTTFVSYLDLYHRWTQQFADRSRHSAVQKILKRIGMQLIVFSALIAGSFLAALFLAKILPALFEIPLRYQPWLDAILWLTALFTCMPVILASLRKLKALGMILAELGIAESQVGKHYKDIRAILASAFLVLGSAFVALLVGLLSSSILPSVGGLGVLAVIAGLFTYFLRGAFNKIYFQGKAALAEVVGTSSYEETDVLRVAGTLTDTGPDAMLPVVQLLLKEARFISVPILKESPASGKLIREIALRTRTGTSILAIDRNSGSLINPSPDEELVVGDTVLLMGTPNQLAKARPLLGSSFQEMALGNRPGESV